MGKFLDDLKQPVPWYDALYIGFCGVLIGIMLTKL